MVNTLMAATFSQNGFDRNSVMETRRKASQLFTKIMRRSKQRALWLTLMGKEDKFHRSDLPSQGACYPV